MLCNSEIIQGINDKTIIIHPFIEENLIKNISYDVTLYDKYFEEKNENFSIHLILIVLVFFTNILLFFLTNLSFYDHIIFYSLSTIFLISIVYQDQYLFIFSNQSIKRVWKLKEAIPLKNLTNGQYSNFIYIDEIMSHPNNNDDKVIIIPPGKMILAATKEFIGSNHFCPILNTKSTAARCLNVGNGSSLLGEPGHLNRWTLEIRNSSNYYHLVIPIKYPIAKFSFIKCDGLVKYEELYNGKYNFNSEKNINFKDVNLNDLEKNWFIDQILPKN